MSTLAALLRIPTPRNDYLRIALVLSLAIHGLLLTLRFVAPQAPAPIPEALEVTLVNARSETAPRQPRMLAQNQLHGGGEAEAGQAASPLPRTVAESPNQIVLAALRKRQQELEAEQQRLYTLLVSKQQAPPESPQSELNEPIQEQGEDELEQDSLILNAKISAIKQRIEEYNAQPRMQFSGPSAQAVDYAAYVEAWRQKIELLGTEHYPAEARGKLYGSLQMTVYIRQDGSLAKVEITRPSSHAVLNLAAARIVQLAAPFAPLPAAIAQHTDVFAITRTWHFEHQSLTTHSP
ncbi:energy transducer TonB [Pollutimonas harenae]|uniref:TonB family protein n=1 Tax=Pollutimonas harenae TaxID=657015 RepID=A0A853GPR6_9BURK|nr:TonB family protein [Pollutimonas harenae]NYT84091.1 TonB family protein [Pollutimonas harenae]TEA73485.1 TonB family protein [Pollutimonas harenae]